MAKGRMGFLLIARALIALFSVSSVHAQASQYVHPPPAPSASDFPQPPSDENVRWRGPVIRGISVQCWSAEPSNPSQFSGGVHGVQKVTAFVPIIDPSDAAHIDTKFRQKTVTSFSGGGATSELKEVDIPPGIFVSFKGHPIFKITQITFPITDKDPPLVGSPKTGVRVTAEFQHEPRMGECYFYVAVWTAVK